MITTKTMRLICLASASSLVMTPALAQAQQATGASDSKVAAAKAAEEVIIVVGSRIDNANIAGALPMSVLNEERIAAVGSVSGDDLFRSIPQAGDVQFQEARTTGNLNDARGDNASINLRRCRRIQRR